MLQEFDAWFRTLAGASQAPHEWQRGLGRESAPRSRLVRIPTGMGKTLGALAAWTYHRLRRRDDAWPRRLVWCLPMRVLVEQTEEVVREALGRAGLLWRPGEDASHAGRVGVHVLMGGADPGGDWSVYPEECAVLVGTQDMLLSRALNRGYASGRAAWPLEFALLSHDALWVLDEVQLMDVGLATSAQLQAFLDDDRAKGLRPRCTWWMSATLQPRWLESADTAHRLSHWSSDPCEIPAGARASALGGAVKSLDVIEVAATDADGLARRILDEHAKLVDGAYGRVTLVVCNTVERARATHAALADIRGDGETELVHGRFRPHERALWRERFLSRVRCAKGADRIIVSTQVVEAGVDISAGCVVTEAAPWPSLVQRFGRCARYGGHGHVLVVDRGLSEETARPYSLEELEAALAACAEIGEVGTARIEDFEASLDAARRGRLYPYAPAHLLVRRDLEDLFDTTADLTGADLDIGRFIRSGDDRDLQVFWLDLPAAKKGDAPPRPADRYVPRREELCAVPFLAARDWLCGPGSQERVSPRLRSGVRAWVWDFIDGEWVVAERSLLLPGRVVCVAADAGGYTPRAGFDPGSTEPVPPVPPAPIPPAIDREIRADERQDGEDLSTMAWKTIGTHASEVVAEMGAIGRALAIPDPLLRVLSLAARWHDCGKAHPAFQGAIRGERRPGRQDIAKAPDEAWPRRPATYRTADDGDRRPGLRHELASALALFAVLERHRPLHPALLGPYCDALARLGRALPAAPACEPATPHEAAVLACTAEEFDLLAYLVASHHGKVRVSLHAAPADQGYRPRAGDHRGPPIRGVREGDTLPPIPLEPGAPALPPLTLTLEPAALGLSARTGRSWRERTIGLLDRFGPAALAWLEALLMAADRRASRMETADPVLAPSTATEARP